MSSERETRYIAVVGGVNVDIGGRAAARLVAGDSNPGAVSVHPGGVGRNIAHNLSLLGVRTELLSALGGDLYAEEIARSCSALGIGLTHALRVPDARTATYLYISEPDGEMALALNDMAVCAHLTPAYLAAHEDVLSGAALIVADANLPAETLEYLAVHAAAPLFVDPVSAAKAGRVTPILPRVHTLKPNRIEAEALSGVAVRDKKSAEEAAAALLRRGVRRVFLSLGEHGLLAAENGCFFWQKRIRAEARNTTGAGDALMAGLAWSCLRGETLARSARLGAAAAAIAAESEETVSPEVSAEAVLRRASEA